MVGELVAVLGASGVGLVGIVTLMILGIFFGLVFPRPTMKRAWADLDVARAENAELRGTLEKQAGLIEQVVGQVGDMKVTSQATLYAMQEIQAAGRYAAGMEALPRTPMQKQTDQES